MLLISCTTPGKVLLRSLPGWVPLGTCTIELLGSVFTHCKASRTPRSLSSPWDGLFDAGWYLLAYPTVP